MLSETSIYFQNVDLHSVAPSTVTVKYTVGYRDSKRKKSLKGQSSFCAVKNMKTIEINNTLDTTFLKINFHFFNVHNVRFKLASFTEQEITFRIYLFCQCPLEFFFWVCQYT